MGDMDSGVAAWRLGSGDGERKASMTRQMPFEPLRASVLFGLGDHESSVDVGQERSW